jgi:multiple sugar transport system permease protein
MKKGFFRRRSLTPLVLLLPTVLVLTLFFFFPSTFNVALSFQDISLFQLKRGGTWIGAGNYIELLRDEEFFSAFWNTLLWLTVATVLIRLVLGVLLALLLNSRALTRWRLTGLARSLLLIPWVTPPVVAVAAWQWLLHPRFGALNQLLFEAGVINQGIPFLVQSSTVWLAIIAVIVWNEVPFVAITHLAGLQAIPKELYEAARVDGATGLAVFSKVTLPLLRPVTTTVTLLITIWTFNNFLFVWLTTRGGPGNYTQVLATHMYTEAFVNYRLGYGATIGVAMTAVMAVFALIYFRTAFKRGVEGA